jgi:hypothetical protein
MFAALQFFGGSLLQARKLQQDLPLLPEKVRRITVSVLKPLMRIVQRKVQLA